MQNEKLTAAHMSEINNIDKTVTIGMLSPENKLVKILPVSLWSLNLIDASNIQATGASSNPNSKRRYHSMSN